MGKFWSEEEKQKLRKLYFNTDIETLLLEFSERSYAAIKLMAAKLNLKRDNFLRIGSIDFLLQDKNESLYIIGFILADGHISKLNRLKIALAKKDLYILKYIADRLGCDLRENKNNFELTLMHRDKIKLLKHKYDISNTKTYIPPSISVFEKLTDDLFISFLVGFIDGDGSISKQYKRNDCKITIKLHNSWKLLLQYFIDRLYKISNKGYYNRLTQKPPNIKFTKDNKYVYINVANGEVLWYLKQFITKNNLTVLERKWSLITSCSQKYKIANSIREKVIELSKSKQNKEIALLLNISKSRVSQILKNRRS